LKAKVFFKISFNLKEWDEKPVAQNVMGGNADRGIPGIFKKSSIEDTMPVNLIPFVMPSVMNISRKSISHHKST